MGRREGYRAGYVDGEGEAELLTSDGLDEVEGDLDDEFPTEGEHPFQ